MLFSSIFFIFLFLPLFLVLYYATPTRYRNLTALTGSYFFYAWGSPKFVFILLLSSVIDFVLSKFIVSKADHKKIFLIIGLISNISFLVIFKYTNFFVQEFSNFLALLSINPANWVKIALPLGISFFTFQKISYLVDVYRKKTKPAETIFDYCLYVSLFPQLIAGPIVRYHDIADQIKKRIHSSEKFMEGIYRFGLGLGKKVLIADFVGRIADNVFALPPGEIGFCFAWLGIFAYAMQIYFDFSGYSDMAIGLGKMMGFDFLENFNKPYISKNFSEFWRRWHISLSNFMKEYLYIPLGGNRVGRKRMYLNLWIVFLISGIWHGANWVFVVWGAYHGFFLMLDKILKNAKTNKIPEIIRLIITFILILIGWVFFRSPDISFAWNYLYVMFNFIDKAKNILLVDLAGNRALTMLGLSAVITFIPALPYYDKFVFEFKKHIKQGTLRMIKFSFAFLIIFISVLALSGSNFNPFIYFRF